MAYEVLGVDTLTGKYKRTGISTSGLGGGFTDEDFDTGAGFTNLTLATNIEVGTKLDVWVDGRMMREGATEDFIRDAALDKITFSITIPENAWVKVRIYS